MTKEEILNKHDTSRKYIEQTCRPELFAAMDEWAKQRAIAFAIDYATRVLTFGYTKAEDVINDRMDDRYNLFIENQKK